jgi:hypothetical protein
LKILSVLVRVRKIGTAEIEFVVDKSKKKLAIIFLINYTLACAFWGWSVDLQTKIATILRSIHASVQVEREMYETTNR